jgi:hypothetical protein
MQIKLKTYFRNGWILVLGIGGTACKSRKPITNLSSQKSQSNELVDISLREYVEKCESVLGTLPQTVNCKSGVEVKREGPIGKGITEIKGKEVHFETCANPSFGVYPEESCDGKSFVVSHPENEKGTKAVSVCRYNNRNGSINFVSAMIAHNPKHGGTCFFLFQKGTKYEESGILPGPSTSNLELDETWQTPTYITRDGLGTCVECHSAYPWIRNRYASAQDADGKPLIPSAILNHKPGTPNEAVKYWVIARDQLSKIHVKFKGMKESVPSGDLWTPVVLNKTSFQDKKSSFCLSCHDIGRLRFMDTYSPAVVGFYPNSLAQNLTRFDIKKLEAFKAAGSIINSEHSVWPDLVWHQKPLSGPSVQNMTLEKWYQRIDSSMTLLGHCSKNPKECGWVARFEPVDDQKLEGEFREAEITNPDFRSKNFSLSLQME